MSLGVSSARAVRKMGRSTLMAWILPDEGYLMRRPARLSAVKELAGICLKTCQTLVPIVLSVCSKVSPS